MPISLFFLADAYLTLYPGRCLSHFWLLVGAYLTSCSFQMHISQLVFDRYLSHLCFLTDTYLTSLSRLVLTSPCFLADAHLTFDSCHMPTSPLIPGRCLSPLRYLPDAYLTFMLLADVYITLCLSDANNLTSSPGRWLSHSASAR